MTKEYDFIPDITYHNNISDFIKAHKKIRYENTSFFEKYLLKDYKYFKELRKKELKLGFFESLFSSNYSFKKKSEYANFKALNEIYKQCSYFQTMKKRFVYDQYKEDIFLTKEEFNLIKENLNDFIILVKEKRASNPILKIKDTLSNF